jgi:hypothetical protein
MPSSAGSQKLRETQEAGFRNRDQPEFRLSEHMWTRMAKKPSSWTLSGGGSKRRETKNSSSDSPNLTPTFNAPPQTHNQTHNPPSPLHCSLALFLAFPLSLPGPQAPSRLLSLPPPPGPPSQALPLLLSLSPLAPHPTRATTQPMIVLDLVLSGTHQ